MGVLEDAHAARRRWHIGARLTRTRASEICDLHAVAAACAAPSPREKFQLTARRVACPRVCSPLNTMLNDVARRARAVGARLPS
eukprot:1694456-Prymnesium_polylepis.1